MQRALKKILRKAFIVFNVLFLCVVAATTWAVLSIRADLPDKETLAGYEAPVMSRVHADDGSLLAEYAQERRLFVPIKSIPKTVVNAFLAADDPRYKTHGGIDPLATLKFAYKAWQRALQPPENGSTITQKVARVQLLADTKAKGIRRKIEEALLAVRIERVYNKDKILELYLNQLNFGRASYGVAGASLDFFGKELDDLTVYEAAYLAALPRSPTRYHPFRHTKAAIARRNWVIDRMAESSFITREASTKAKSKPLSVNLRPRDIQVFAAEYFAKAVRIQLAEMFGEKKLYGKDGGSGGLSARTTLVPKLQRLAKRALVAGLVKYDRDRGWRAPIGKIEINGDWGISLAKYNRPGDIRPWRLGVVLEVTDKIIVGLPPETWRDGEIKTEREAVEITHEGLKWALEPPKTETGTQTGTTKKEISDILEPGDVVYVSPDTNDIAGSWSLMQLPQVSGGLVAMDPHTGRVHAVMGGFSTDASKIDRAIDIPRKPGTAFLPFVFAAALDNGYMPTSIINDGPFTASHSVFQELKRFQPTKNKFLGPTTLRTGLERSRNMIAARLAGDVGMPLITEYARRFGLYDELIPTIPMALGEGKTTLMRVVTAYGMLVNGGKQILPTLIDRIQDRYGKTIWRHDQRECQSCQTDTWKEQPVPDLPDKRRQVLDPHTAHQITSMLEGIVKQGAVPGIKQIGKPLLGLAGHSNSGNDAWFIGASPDLVVGVFIGYDKPVKLARKNPGRTIAAPIFANFMKQALADKPAAPFRIPPGIKLVRVNRKTGLRTSVRDKNVILEAFKPSEEPNDSN